MAEATKGTDLEYWWFKKNTTVHGKRYSTVYIYNNKLT